MVVLQNLYAIDMDKILKYLQGEKISDEDLKSIEERLNSDLYKMKKGIYKPTSF